MPRFYFHLHNDIDAPDSEGTDLPDLAAAKAVAFDQVRALIGAMVVDEGRISLQHRIDIEDEQGAMLQSVLFGDTVTIET